MVQFRSTHVGRGGEGKKVVEVGCRAATAAAAVVAAALDTGTRAG